MQVTRLDDVLQNCEPKPQKSVKTLETLCLNKIALFMWYVYQIPKNLCILAILAAELKKMNHNFSSVIKYGKENFQRAIELVLNKIMADNTCPYKLKIKIALRLISLEEDVSRSILELTSRLKKPNIHNIIYCVANAVIQDNKLDRVETLRRILYFSYFRVKFDTHSITKFCNINSDTFESMYYYLAHRKRLANKIKTLKIASKMAFEIDNLEYVWMNDVMKAYDRHNLSFIKKQLLDHLAVNAPLEILEHEYNKLKMSKRQYILSRALIFALVSDNDVNENILFLLTKVRKETKLRIYMRFHDNILRKLFMSSYADFCFEVFTEIYKYDKFDMCLNILRRALCYLTSRCDDYYYDVLYTNGKNIFLNMWKIFPASIKSKFGEEFHDILDLLIEKDEFNILSSLMADPAFNDQQQFEQRVYIMSKLVLESSYDKTEKFKDAKQKLEDFEKEYPDANVAWMKNNMDCGLLKQIILAVDYVQPYFDALKLFFETETSGKVLKGELLTDSAFMQKAICKISDCGEESVKEFLEWMFDDDKVAIDNFLQIPFIVDIYKLYLLNSSSPNLFPFSDLNVSREYQKNIKATVREDDELISKMFQTYFSFTYCNILSPCIGRFCPDVSQIFETIYNDNALDAEKEYSHLLEHHLVSENGLNFIYQMFGSNFYSVRVYLNNTTVATGFVRKMYWYCYFSKRWLNDNHHLINALTKALDQRGHPNSLERTKEINVEEFLLPFETERDNRVIVDANYRMFRTIIKLQTHILTEIHEEIEKDSKKISSLTKYSMDFASRWRLSFPMVIS